MTPHNLGKITVSVIRLSKLAGLGVFAVALMAITCRIRKSERLVFLAMVGSG
jgi:hypothetical protein